MAKTLCKHCKAINPSEAPRCHNCGQRIASGPLDAATCSARFRPMLGMHAKDFWHQAQDDGFSWRPEQKGQALRLLDMQRYLAALEKSGLLTEREACTIGMRLRRKIDALDMRPNDSHRCSLCQPNANMEARRDGAPPQQ